MVNSFFRFKEKSSGRKKAVFMSYATWPSVQPKNGDRKKTTYKEVEMDILDEVVSVLLSDDYN